MLYCVLLSGYIGNMQTRTDTIGILKICSEDPVNYLHILMHLCINYFKNNIFCHKHVQPNMKNNRAILGPKLKTS